VAHKVEPLAIQQVKANGMQRYDSRETVQSIQKSHSHMRQLHIW